MSDTTQPSTSRSSLIAAHKDHRRSWRDFLYIYPVISRRSRGVSIGINLNPDKTCNFNCIYCFVDRKTPAQAKTVDFTLLEKELRGMIAACQSGALFRDEPFASVPPPLRRLNDIAFSGNGEPTGFGPFAEIVDLVARVKRETAGNSVKIVLITNGSGLNRPVVKRGLQIMNANQGEVWVKLDAGTEDYFKSINRSSIPLARILNNIEKTIGICPICIQSLFLRVQGEMPSEAEIVAYCGHLRRFKSQGGQIREVQIYTVARPTPAPWAIALPDAQLLEIGRRVREITGLPVECYPGGD